MSPSRVGAPCRYGTIDSISHRAHRSSGPDQFQWTKISKPCVACRGLLRGGGLRGEPAPAIPPLRHPRAKGAQAPPHRPCTVPGRPPALRVHARGKGLLSLACLMVPVVPLACRYPVWHGLNEGRLVAQNRPGSPHGPWASQTRRHFLVTSHLPVPARPPTGRVDDDPGGDGHTADALLIPAAVHQPQRGPDP
jgi:hypothetical protein